MDIPLWFFVACVGVLGIRLVRVPWWLIALLLLGGYLLANSLFAPVIDPALK
ncbi:hypothetical protein V2W30_14070 [Streptomyces sp. Q6]|uniref:Uncharacterized protein n=1 Tax=Streptomyces citrinus TaxID=3118173 RepID=A0ACD5AAW5_9ACTN